MCHRIGRPPIRTIGFGTRRDVAPHPQAEAAAEEHDLHRRVCPLEIIVPQDVEPVGL